MVDTRSVSNHKRRSGISLCLADSLQRLRLVSTHSDLCDIDISVSSSDHTKVFLAHALTHSSELRDSADRRCFGCLTTGVGIYLGIEHEDIHIFAGSNHMVETAVTDVVGSTVATYNPLAAFHDMVFVLKNLFAGVATACLASSHHRLVETVRYLCALRVSEPLGEHRLEFLGAA